MGKNNVNFQYRMKKLLIIAIAMMASANIHAQIEEGMWYVTPKAGVSVADITSFMIKARYNLGLTKVMKDDPESSQHRVWQFTLGYKIPMGD